MKKFRVRAMTRDDFQAVTRIDLLSFGSECWPRGILDAEYSERTANSLVAVLGPSGDADGEPARISGFVIYHSNSRRPGEAGYLEVTRLAVHPDHRRKGVGTFLVSRVAKYLRPSRPEVVADVPDSLLPHAHQFFRACGFRAVGVVRGFCGEQDATRMVLPLPTEAVV